MELLTLAPEYWEDYELLDCGDGRKLERFGRVVTARPEPQALWAPSLGEAQWEARAGARFRKDKGSEDRGEWVLRRGTPQQWFVEYRNPQGLKLRMRLGLTSFKHVGIFPEQAANWDYIYDTVGALRRAGVDRQAGVDPFVYAGGASVGGVGGGLPLAAVAAARWRCLPMRGSSTPTSRARPAIFRHS